MFMDVYGASFLDSVAFPSFGCTAGEAQMEWTVKIKRPVVLGDFW